MIVQNLNKKEKMTRKNCILFDIKLSLKNLFKYKVLKTL